MTDAQLKEFKERLENNLKDLEERIQHREEFNTNELSQYDNHPGDNATQLFDKERGLAITEFKQEEIDDTRAALQAIEDGTYGKCAVCGREIQYDRLDILPTALTCIDHADQQPDMNTRPGEEDIMEPMTDQPVEKEDDRLRDFNNSFEEVEDFGSSDTPQDQPNEDQENFYDDNDTNRDQ
ncbi:TraR/DksA C4-type zinc finger protein [Planococcus lenghuensis]|uniref:Molecular chaperone DnaK n=1 Tax=Planococcus lenghuensis TaxID=2213202 RepID=A0A1Q2KUP1_9BACL|nr:TraR/DksA C4-type zinc finger protein [Planococcus lenghuensis]AQQ51863.1 molecular chaperone DnaK [Planococcus lenghuensis]